MESISKEIILEAVDIINNILKEKKINDTDIKEQLYLIKREANK